MYIEAKLVFKNYIPIVLTEDTLFLNYLHTGSDKETIEVFVFNEEQISCYTNLTLLFDTIGYPVHPYIIDEEESVIATPEEIAWFDPGDDFDEYTDFGVKEMNFILREFDGWLEIDVDEEFEEVLLEEDLCTIRFLTEEEEL